MAGYLLYKGLGEAQVWSELLSLFTPSPPFSSWNYLTLYLPGMSSTDIEEKGIKPYVSDGGLSDEPELPPNLQSVAHRGFLGTLRHYENLLDKKIGVEAHGPARILPEQRDPEFGKWNKQIVMALMWASGTMNLSCFTTGFLGWELGLSLSQTIWITIVASFVGSSITVRS
jgi:hypothetical protein